MGIRALATVVIALLISTAAATSASAAPRDDVVSKTNSARAAAGLPALVPDAKLNAAAQEWAQQMANSKQMVHSSNDWRAARIPAGWTSHGENIAWGQANATSVMTSWMNSEGHRNNILRAAYTRIGVGYVASGNFWVQIFGGYPSKPPVPKPFGQVDEAKIVVTPQAATLEVRGWSVDRVNPKSSIETHIYITSPSGSVNGIPLKANQARPDVGKVYPQAGSAHGWSASVPVSSPGVYRVCAYAIGTVVDGPNNPEIGCSNVSPGAGKPTGNVDEVAIKTVNNTPSISIRGWALDNAQRSKSTEAHVYITNPQGKTRAFALQANGSRPDIAKAFPGAGANHGYSATTALSGAGNYKVCIYAISAPIFGGSNTPMPCRTVKFGPSKPMGSLDSARYDPAQGAITARGWVMDDAARSFGTQVHLYLTTPSGKQGGYAVDANAQRPDVGRIFSGAGDSHGYSRSIPVAQRGTYQLCAYSISAPVFGSGNTPLPCKSVVVG